MTSTAGGAVTSSPSLLYRRCSLYINALPPAVWLVVMTKTVTWTGKIRRRRDNIKRKSCVISHHMSSKSLGSRELVNVYRHVVDFEGRPQTSIVKIIHPLTLLYRRDMRISHDTTQSKTSYCHISVTHQTSGAPHLYPCGTCRVGLTRPRRSYWGVCHGIGISAWKEPKRSPEV